MVKDKLDSDGAVLLNVFGSAGNDRLVSAIYTTLQTQFAYTRAFALPTETADEVQNRILMGSHHPIQFQVRQMAGFVEQEPEEGYIIVD